MKKVVALIGAAAVVLAIGLAGQANTYVGA